MIPVYQTVFGDHGNCFAACVASIMELRLADLPSEFVGHDEWAEWLMARGMAMKTRKWPGLPNGQPWPENTYVIADGDSPRGFLRGHAVVAFNGMVVHDPFPNAEAVTEFWGWSQIWTPGKEGS